MSVRARRLVVGDGEEVKQIDNSCFVDPSSLQDIGIGQISLLANGCPLAMFCRDTEMAAFVLVEQPAEDRRGVKYRPAQKIQAPVFAH
jgi:hypothetical protein